MLPGLKDIETVAGRITIGATVRSTRHRDVQGAVTAIRWTGFYYSIEVAGCHSDNAANYELLSAPTWHTFNYINPHAQAALSGNFEIIIPGEGDRIYFTDTPQQAIALIAAIIGLYDQEREVAYLAKLAHAGPVDEHRWRGSAGSIGHLAYVSTRLERPAPRFAVGDSVTFHRTGTVRTVSGVALLKDRLDYGKTQWHYFYAEAPANDFLMSEAHTEPARPALTPVRA